MQTNLMTETLPSSSATLLIDRTTLWDNSSKDDDNNLEKCVASLNDQAWQSVGSLKDLIDSKYGLSINQIRSNELIPWTNSDLVQVRREEKCCLSSKCTLLVE